MNEMKSQHKINETDNAAVSPQKMKQRKTQFRIKREKTLSMRNEMYDWSECGSEFVVNFSTIFAIFHYGIVADTIF